MVFAHAGSRSPPRGPRPRPGSGPLRAIRLAAAATVAFGTVSGPGPLLEAGGREATGPKAAQFAPVVTAWQSRDAAGVAAFVKEKHGRLDLSLFGSGDRAVSGRFSRENAEKALQKYFEALDRARLEDKTPSTTPTAPTRSYDYAYRPRGGQERTTRLALTLAADGEGRWWLVAATERQRPK